MGSVKKPKRKPQNVQGHRGVGTASGPQHPPSSGPASVPPASLPVASGPAISLATPSPSSGPTSNPPATNPSGATLVPSGPTSHPSTPPVPSGPVTLSVPPNVLAAAGAPAAPAASNSPSPSAATTLSSPSTTLSSPSTTLSSPSMTTPSGVPVSMLQVSQPLATSSAQGPRSVATATNTPVPGVRPTRSHVAQASLGRQDLIGFVDSLYAGAIALGITKFIEKYEAGSSPSAEWDGLFRFAVAVVSIGTATAIVLDDWRHARWVNADYGFRLNARGASARYWLDCAGAIVSFFLLSTSFVSPLRYLIWLAIFYAIGGLWAWQLQKEIEQYVGAVKEFPLNSLGISLPEAEHIRPQCPETADYRVDFVMRSQFVAALIFGLAAAFYFTNSRLQPGDALAMLNVVLTTGIPLATAAAIKFFYHYRRRDFFRSIDAYRNPRS